MTRSVDSMPQHRRQPPSHAMLTRFLRERRPQSIAEAAALVGRPAAEIAKDAASAEVLLPGHVIAWREVASWVLEAWPLAMLYERLGPHGELLPTGLQLIPMPLEQPAYIVTALRAQWKIEPMPHRTLRPPTFADYMTDLLHRTIDADTVEALRADEEFVRAYDFPGNAE